MCRVGEAWRRRLQRKNDEIALTLSQASLTPRELSETRRRLQIINIELFFYQVLTFQT
jgi:hypothetical protein